MPLDHFACAVQLGDAAALFGAELDARHVAQQHRRAALRLEHDCCEIADVAQIAAAADDIFGFGHLDDAAADIPVAGADGVGDAIERDAVGLQFLRIDDDLVLLLEAADAGDLGDALGRDQLIAQNQSWMLRNSASVRCAPSTTYW